MASLSLKHINKTYPNGFEAVKDFNLEIEDKELDVYKRQPLEFSSVESYFWKRKWNVGNLA